MNVPSYSSPASSGVIRVVFVEDHDLVREAVKALLKMEPRIEVIGEARDGLTAIDLVKELNPDILLLDLEIPQLHGLEVIRTVGSCFKTVVLTAHLNYHFLAQALGYAALGYVVKDSCASELITAIKTVASGEVFVSPQLQGEALETILKSHGGLRTEWLTSRELQVLELAAAGETTTGIAAKLSISRRTAVARRAGLMKKLALKTQTDLVFYAIRNGIISANP